MSDVKKCAHDRCNCNVSGGKKFCSEVCEDAVTTGTQTLACGCPHASCGGKL